MRILAIESSCDETAAAISEDGRKILSNVVLSQADMHAVFGGVVPEIASRRHVEGVCGVVSGAAMALSAMFVTDRAHASEKIKPLTKEFIERFEAELGMSDCARLKAKYRTPEEGCACLILAGAKILDDIVARERG